MFRSRNNLILQRPAQIAEIIAVADDAHDQAAVVLGVILGRAQSLGIDDAQR